MRIIARKTLRTFVESLKGGKDQAAVKSALDSWFHEVQVADWRTPPEVTASYANASIVAHDRVVFNIKGNSYRLVTAVDFERGILWIKWIGTHSDYDRVDVTEVEYDD